MNTTHLALNDALTQCRLRVGLVQTSQTNTMGCVMVKGADAASFLQAQLTNDVLKLDVGAWQWSALLDRKAHILAWFQVVRVAEHAYALLAEQTQCSTLAELLERVHFIEDVTIQVMPTLDPWVALVGPWAAQSLIQLGLPVHDLTQANHCLTWETDLAGNTVTLKAIPSDYWGVLGYWLFDATYLKSPSDDIVTSVATQQAIVTQITRMMPETIPLIDPRALDLLRLEAAGLCRYGFDMTDTVALPATGLEWTSVSYDKGCYPGQEVVAKVRTYGAMPRALMGIKALEATWPDMTTDTMTSQVLSIEHQGKSIGTMHSRALSPTLNQPIALAYLDKAYRVPGQVLDVALVGDSTSTAITLETVALPFVAPTQPQQLAKQAYDDAISAFTQAKDDEAIRLLQQAIAYDPLLADAYESLGVILGRHKRYDEAIALMETLKALDPDCVMAHSNLSVFYMELGDKERAEEEKAKATVLSFSLQMKKQRQQQDESQQREQQRAALTEKLAMFKEVLGLDPDDALANYGLGSAYVELDEYAKAVEPLKKALAQNTQYTVAYLALVKAYKGLAQWPDAHETLEKGLQVAQTRGDLMPLKQLQALQSQLPHN